MKTTYYFVLASKLNCVLSRVQPHVVSVAKGAKYIRFWIISLKYSSPTQRSFNLTCPNKLAMAIHYFSSSDCESGNTNYGASYLDRCSDGLNTMNWLIPPTICTEHQSNVTFWVPEQFRKRVLVGGHFIIIDLRRETSILLKTKLQGIECFPPGLSSRKNRLSSNVRVAYASRKETSPRC